MRQTTSLRAVTAPSVQVSEALAGIGVVPVVVLEQRTHAVTLARALQRGGLPVAEVTFRTDAAADAIRAIAAEVPDVLVGAGTVSSVAQVEAARAAGARFAVTPGFNRRVVERCLEVGLPIVPGVNSPGFVETALEYGLDVLKFFPAEASGGVAMLKALAGPYGGVRFMPSGGIGPKNIESYLSLPAVFACGGSWMVDPKLLAAGDFRAVEKLAREAAELAARVRRAKAEA
jgi:2-dehydro-3-deoxyphosphogluconate aldolase/(4S)-4-hydroxy-2-oxoglutarate aldolase